MKVLSLPEGAKFSNKDILIFFLPVLFEQLMVSGLSMADTFMVSFLGETAVAGVALVSRIDTFVKMFIVAMAQGGSVVLSQYIGAKNSEKAAVSLKSNIRIVVAVGLALMLVMVIFKNQVLRLLFGGAEEQVLSISSSYFTITAFSYPFLALYYACSAVYRAMGESRIPFVGSVVMMCLNLLLKYIFVFKMNMGVAGAALSTLFAMVITGFILLGMLKSHNNRVPLHGLLKPDFDGDIVKKIVTISVPNGLEQGMFQLGALMIAGLVSGLGTASIAADSIARTLTPFLTSLSAGFNAIMMMVIGQCMGAGEIDEAKMYTKHILKLDYLITAVVAILFMIFTGPLIQLFQNGASWEAQVLAHQILTFYTVGFMILYPLSFSLASSLRATGDTKFVMLVASGSMLLFRVGTAYFFAYALNLGVLGTWYAMVSDWVIRTIIFVVRFCRGKWQQNKVI